MKTIYLTLQQGEHLACWRLTLPRLAVCGLALVGGLGITLFPGIPADPQTLEQAKRRMGILQAELERATSQQAMTADLLNGKLAEAQKRLARMESQGQALNQLSPNRPAPVRLRLLEEAMDRHERQQINELTTLADDRRNEATRIDKALAEARISLPELPTVSSDAGGPFIPLAAAFSGLFADRLAGAEPWLMRHAHLTEHLPNLPLRAPFSGRLEISSGFGARADPFHGRAAWHSGIDLRSDAGSQVLATGAGNVTATGWNGAYGLSVDIDHGNGLSTRYAHLSRLLVREGERVDALQPIALSGASGRTKGAHLHYELRVDGEATDPRRLFKAGEKIGLLPIASSRMREAAL